MRDEVGVMLPRGIGVGFENEMPKVERDIENSMLTDFSQLKNDMSNIAMPFSGSNSFGGLNSALGLISNTMNSLVSIVGEMSNKMGYKIVLDNGVLVGQLAPQLDTAIVDLQKLRAR
jgi:hypothetical protein